MDIMHLIDRLEEVLNESRQLPFTHNIIVDEERVFEIIDQMRALIPEEVKKAQQLLAQKDRILAQAQEEANRTLQLPKKNVTRWSSVRQLSRLPTLALNKSLLKQESNKKTPAAKQMPMF